MTAKVEYQYVIRKVGECTDADRISVDVNFTVASLAGMIAAHNLGSINIEDEVWFGNLGCYAFAPKEAPALVAIPK